MSTYVYPKIKSNSDEIHTFNPNIGVFYVYDTIQPIFKISFNVQAYNII